ncbi:hypothetical protein DPMN_156056 [Dreissena polymorpha]|uniref:Uncharacterized protein n=1 Tax=Dreissena polymorpha TaxID=45954 RepID=A0A9D4FTP6_DREPO|nr:hypothetical protein DPMN_156056 [Dreissena polymorpha]
MQQHTAWLVQEVSNWYKQAVRHHGRDEGGRWDNRAQNHPIQCKKTLNPDIK